MRYLVPDAVAAYIGDHALYQDHTGGSDPIVTEPACPSADPTGPSADGLPRRDAARRRPPAERPPLDLARRIVELAEDKKAADIVLLELPR